jgi:hypothetical protein
VEVPVGRKNPAGALFIPRSCCKVNGSMYPLLTAKLWENIFNQSKIRQIYSEIYSNISVIKCI